jgi:hypothetical protein
MKIEVSKELDNAKKDFLIKLDNSNKECDNKINNANKDFLIQLDNSNKECNNKINNIKNEMFNEMNNMKNSYQNEFNSKQDQINNLNNRINSVKISCYGTSNKGRYVSCNPGYTAVSCSCGSACGSWNIEGTGTCHCQCGEWAEVECCIITS